MPDLTDLAKKAFYLGVGLASYAGEKAVDKVSELQAQAQEVAAELVKRGEMTAEESRQWVDTWVKTGQPPTTPASPPEPPRHIEILIADDDSPQPPAS
jgi:polyhydroxyalkanoate synthesis regulator phasin